MNVCNLTLSSPVAAQMLIWLRKHLFLSFCGNLMSSVFCDWVWSVSCWMDHPSIKHLSNTSQKHFFVKKRSMNLAGQARSRSDPDQVQTRSLSTPGLLTVSVCGCFCLSPESRCCYFPRVCWTGSVWVCSCALMFVCVLVRAYVCVCVLVHVCSSMRMLMCVHVYVCVCVLVHSLVHKCVHGCSSLWPLPQLCTSVRMWVSLCTCMCFKRARKGCVCSCVCVCARAHVIVALILFKWNVTIVFKLFY